ncbi:MAG: MFS transporter [Candidatus Woesearchaeota archaeon]
MDEDVSSFFKEDMTDEKPDETVATTGNSSAENRVTTDMLSGNKPEAKSTPEEKDTFESDYEQQQIKQVRKRYKKLNGAFTGKEFLDRIGYGFAAPQFITILFFLTGASPLLVGVVNGFRDLLGGLYSSFLQEFSQVKTFSKRFISSAGILFGFSLIGVVLAIRTSSVWIYAGALLIGSFGIVAYGEMHHRVLDASLRHERRSRFLKSITHYGLLITAATFFISGYLLERFGMGGSTIEVFGTIIPISGYFISFEIAAVAFILSGFILSNTPLKEEKKTYHTGKFVKEYFSNGFKEIGRFLKNKYLFFLFLGALLLGVVESLGASFYGYHIFTVFQDQYFGGFLNIAIIFVIALLASTIGPAFTRYLKRHTGLAPMFVFGTLLMALLPLILVYNPHFYAVIVATSCAIIGSSILGVAQGLLAQKLLPRSERASFFNSLGIVIALPFIILVPAGAYLASIDFLLLFKIIALTLLGLVAPLYFTLVLVSHKQRL